MEASRRLESIVNGGRIRISAAADSVAADHREYSPQAGLLGPRPAATVTWSMRRWAGTLCQRRVVRIAWRGRIGGL